ncbi:hypothetical protein GCM10009700_20350 [Brevibacterium sanguinis]|jgi:transposase-like protein
MATCATLWCDRDAVSRGLCNRCRTRLVSGTSMTLPPRPYTTAAGKARLRAEATRRREAGQGIADIAAALGVSPTALGKWLRAWGVNPGERLLAPNQCQPWSVEDAEFALSRTDLTVAERAAVLGRSVSGVEELIRQHRLGRR